MNVTIKDLPVRVHRRLKARANVNKRSLNWEVIDILEKAVESTPVNVEALLAEVKEIHARIKVPALTEEILRKAKTEGRP